MYGAAKPKFNDIKKVELGVDQGLIILCGLAQKLDKWFGFMLHQIK
jgi:hypothetical protein